MINPDALITPSPGDRVTGLRLLAGAGDTSLRPLPARLTCDHEAALIERLQYRDSSALGEIYDLCGRLTYSLIVRIVRDGGIAEDLVQETFLCLWRRVSLFDSQKGALVAWLLTIARNRALDHLRSSDR